MSHFNSLTLNLERKPCYTLGTLLDDFTALEEIENVHCDKCTVLRARHMTRELLQAVIAMPEESMGEIDKACLIQRLESIERTLSDNEFSESAMAELKITPNEKSEGKKTKQVVISMPPECLALHFNRSTFDGITVRKNYANVDLPPVLDISPWCLGVPRVMGAKDSMLQRSSSDEAVESMLYRLDAVILHRGCHNSGHYITYRKIHPSADHSADETSNDGGKTWWKISDTHVSKVKPSEMDTAGEVYMAFYSRIAPNAESKDEKAVQHRRISDEDTSTNSSTDEKTGILTPLSDSEPTASCGLPFPLSKSARRRARAKRAKQNHDLSLLKS